MSAENFKLVSLEKCQHTIGQIETRTAERKQRAHALIKGKFSGVGYLVQPTDALFAGKNRQLRLLARGDVEHASDGS